MNPLSAAEINQLKSYPLSDKLGFEIGLVGENLPDFHQFEGLAGQMASAIPGLIFQKKADSFGLPGLCIGPNIIFHLLPKGSELTPFLDTITAVSKGDSGLSPLLLEKTQKIRNGKEVTLFVSTRCPHCPQAVKMLSQIAIGNPLIRLSVIDAEQFMDKAAEYGVKSLPTILVGDLRWTQIPPIDECLRALDESTSSAMGRTAIKSMLEEGQAEKLAQLMSDAGFVFPAFLDLLTHDKWPTRLGAMVTFEYLASQAPDLTAACLTTLWERYDTSDNTLKGDILHLVGESGSPLAVNHLKQILKTGDLSAELLDAAQEALEKLERNEKKRGLHVKTDD